MKDSEEQDEADDRIIRGKVCIKSAADGSSSSGSDGACFRKELRTSIVSDL